MAGAVAGALCTDLRRGRGSRRRENCLRLYALLQFQLEAILLHLEDREVVLLHQIDDGFDVFEFQNGLPGQLRAIR